MFKVIRIDLIAIVVVVILKQSINTVEVEALLVDGVVNKLVQIGLKVGVLYFVART